MVRIINVVDKIAEKCFTEEEKAILEFQVGTRPITIASQLKYYYITACWEGEEEDLYDAICIRKQEREDLLRKIKSLKESINIAIDPNSYDDVYLRIEGSKRSGTSINISTEGSLGTSHSTANAVSDDKSDSWSLSEAKNAVGEMDEVNKIKDVWNDKELNHGSLTIDQQPNNNPSSTLTTPSITKPSQPSTDIKYRHFNLSESGSEDVSTSSSFEKSNRDDNSSATSSSSGIDVNKSNTDKNIGSRRSKTGEQLVNMWKDELPNLRNRYWLMFHGLFVYERNY